MNAVELRHLRTLVALKETGSLMEAASQVHLTQSALSHQIKELENRLNCKLLIRKSRPLKFTPAGNALLKLAYEVLPKVKEVEGELTKLSTGKTGRLFIAIECHSCFQWLLPTLKQFHNRWPEVETDLLTSFSFSPFAALERGHLDLVITSDQVDESNLIFEPLFKYEMLLAVGQEHWLAKKTFIEPQDLADETLITYPLPPSRLDVFSRFLMPAQVEPAKIRTVEMTLMIIQMITSGRGVCVLPNWALTEYLEKNYILAKPLGKKGLWCTLYAAIKEDAAHLAFLQDFIHLARNVPHEHLTGIL